MEVGLYTTFDRVAMEFGAPFASANHGTAKRYFSHIMSNAPMVASDNQLFFLGSYNTVTGVIVVKKMPEFLCNFTAGMTSSFDEGVETEENNV